METSRLINQRTRLIRGPGSLALLCSSLAYKRILAGFLVLASATSGLNLPATPQRVPPPPPPTGALRLQELLGVRGACSSAPGTTSMSKAVQTGQAGTYSLARS